jgi:AcrR family transcriptional regulator
MALQASIHQQMNLMEVPKSQKRGRRSGNANTKNGILKAAAACFARSGYDGTTLRSIGAAAAVDPALIHHYFKTKRALFEATLALPDFSDAHLAAAIRGPAPGEALVAAFLAAWDGPTEGSSFAQLLRSASTDRAQQARLADLIASTIIAPATAAIEPPATLPRLRATLVAAQLAGLAWTRYVLRLEPLASASAALVAKTLGPSLTATITGSPRH